MASNNQVGIILTVDGRAVPAELARAGQAFEKFSSGAQQSLEKVLTAQERQERLLQQLAQQTDGLTRAMQVNAAANSAGAQAAQNAAQALQQQSGASSAAAAAAQSQAKAAAGAAQSSGQMGAQATAASAAVGGLTSRILATVTATLSLSKALQEMDAWTNMNNRIKLVTETQGQFVQAQANILQIANDTRQPLKETADLYQRLAMNQKTLGLSGTELSGIVKTISQSMVISGVSTASGAAALMQLGQAFNSGVLRGEEFNSVMEQAPGLMQAIAAGMGKTVGEMRALAEAGKITTEALVKALQNQAAAVEANYGKMGATIGQSLTVAGNRFTEFVGRMDEATGVSKALSGAIIGLSDNMGPLLTMTGALVAAGLATWMTSAATAAGGLSVAIGGVGLAIRGVFAAMGPAGWLILGLGAAATAWQLLGDKSATAGRQMETAADKANATASKLVAGIVPALNTAIAAYDKMLEKQRQALGTAKTPVEEVAKSLKEADLNLQKLAQQVARAQQGTGEYLNMAPQQRAAAEKAVTAELVKAGTKRAELTARENEYNAGVVTQYVKGKERQTEAGLKLLQIEEAKAKRDQALAAAGSDRAKQEAVDAAYRVELANLEEKSTKKKTAASVKLVDTELAGLKAKLDAERQYGEQLSTSGLKAKEWTEGQKQAAKLSYEVAQGDVAAARSHDAKAKAQWTVTRAELEGRRVAAEALGQQQASNQAREEALRTLGQQTGKAGEAAAALEAENQAWGKSKAAIESAALAVLQLKKARLTGQETQAYREELDRAIAAQQRWVDALGQADYKKQSQAIEEWNRSATEQAALYQDELRLSGMTALEQAKITAERATRLKLAKAEAEIDRQTFSDNPYEDYGKKQELRRQAQAAAQIESSAAVNKVIQEDWAKTSEKIGDSLTDALLRGFESGKDFARNLRDTVVNMFKTLVLRPIISAVINPVAGAITGALGLGGSTAAAAGQAGGPALGTAGSLHDVYRFLSGGIRDSIANGFTKLASTEIGQKLGLYDADAGVRGLTESGQMASSTLQSAGSAMTAYSISKALSGEYKIGNGKIMDALTAVGGWFDPTGGLLSGAISAGLNRAFGMGTKKVESAGITGTFSASGASVQGYSDWTQKGGWFRSNKSGTSYSAVSSELDQSLDTALKSVTAANKVYAGAIGLSASAVDGFSQSIKLSLKDMDAAGQQKAISDALTGFGTAMADQAYGAAIAQFKRAGETTDATLARLSSSLLNVNDVMGSLGSALYSTSVAGADMASQLIDVFGGFEKLTAQTGSYYQAFYTEAERAATTTRQLTQALAAMGLKLPESRDGWRALVEAQDLTTEAGRRAYASLIGLSGEFDSIAPKIDTLAGKFGSLISGLSDEATKLIDGQIQLSQSAATAARNVASTYRDAMSGLRTASESILMKGVGGRQSAQMAYSTQLSRAQGGDVDAMKALPGLTDALLAEARSSSASAVDFAIASAQVANQLNGVAAVADVLGVGADYQSKLYDVNTSLLEVTRDQLASGNLTVELLQQIQGALGTVDTSIKNSANLTVGVMETGNGGIVGALVDNAGTVVAGLDSTTVLQLVGMQNQNAAAALQAQATQAAMWSSADWQRQAAYDINGAQLSALGSQTSSLGGSVADAGYLQRVAAYDINGAQLSALGSQTTSLGGSVADAGYLQRVAAYDINAGQLSALGSQTTSLGGSVADAGYLQRVAAYDINGAQLSALGSQTTSLGGSVADAGYLQRVAAYDINAGQLAGVSTLTSAVSGQTISLGSLTQQQIGQLQGLGSTQSKALGLTDIVASATDGSETLLSSVLNRLSTQDTGSANIIGALNLGNAGVLGKLAGIEAAIRQQAAAQAAELQRQQSLSNAQKQLEQIAGHQKNVIDSVNAGIQGIWSLASDYGLGLLNQGGSTANFSVGADGLFSSDYYMTTRSRNNPAFNRAYYASGGVYDQTYNRAGELQSLASQVSSARDLVKSLGGVPAFSTGGYTGFGGKHEPAGIVHAGEVVFSQDDIARLGGVRVVEAIRTGRAPGYADGGVVGVAPVPVFAGRAPMASGNPGEKSELMDEVRLMREALDAVVRAVKAMDRNNIQGHKRTEEQVGGVVRMQRGWTANGLPAQEGAAFA